MNFRQIRAKNYSGNSLKGLEANLNEIAVPTIFYLNFWAHQAYKSNWYDLHKGICHCLMGSVLVWSSHTIIIQFSFHNKSLINCREFFTVNLCKEQLSSSMQLIYIFYLQLSNSNKSCILVCEICVGVNSANFVA